jgi:hypothetical protein
MELLERAGIGMEADKRKQSPYDYATVGREIPQTGIQEGKGVVLQNGSSQV